MSDLGHAGEMLCRITTTTTKQRENKVRKGKKEKNGGEKESTQNCVYIHELEDCRELERNNGGGGVDKQLSDREYKFSCKIPKLLSFHLSLL